MKRIDCSGSLRTPDTGFGTWIETIQSEASGAVTPRVIARCFSLYILSSVAAVSAGFANFLTSTLELRPL